MKKLFAILLALVMMLSMAAMAQTEALDPANADNASITIKNASKGETYSVYQLFDATVTGDEDGSIAYTGTIPDALSAYFQADSAGNISLMDDVVEADLFAALKTWAGSATATASAESDGSELVFAGLPYGYYVVTTTQGETAITVTSTNPDAEIYDKNSTDPITPPADGEVKKADKTNVSIGDTVTYTIEFSTANYDDDKQIISYTITDTLPEFLSDVTVQSIIVTDADGAHDITAQFDADGKIQIAWVANGANLYTNGATIEITYTATVNDQAAIAGEGNKNEVEISYSTTDGPAEGEEIPGEEIIKTYAIAVQKVDQAGNALAGATFSFPFAAELVDGETNVYVVTDIEGDATEITTDDTGLIIIKGVAAADYSITETVAPNGYNKLVGAVEVTATELSTTTTNTTTYLDAEGNVVDTQEEATTTVNVTIDELAADSVVVVNKTGSELPSTGGIGTTIFYVVGGLMMAAAVVILVAKKKVASK